MSPGLFLPILVARFHSMFMIDKSIGNVGPSDIALNMLGERLHHAMGAR